MTSLPLGSYGEDFTVDGVSLYTYAYSISTLAGMEHFPPRLVDNLIVPGRNGRTWQYHTYDQQTLTLGMWVRGCNENGIIPPQGERAQFNSNLRKLRTLFGPTGRQLALTRTRLYVTGMETHTGTGECAAGSGDASGDGEFNLVPVTHKYATFTVDIVMADPFWYGPQQSITLPGTGVTISNPGEATTYGVTVTLVGPLTNPQVTNQTIRTGYGSGIVSVAYNDTIASGQSVILDCSKLTATLGGTSVVGKVTHTGWTQWMLLQPGNNVMTLTNAQGGVVGAGHAVVTYSPPYF